jgi:urease accessory protein
MAMPITTDAMALLKLLQLASPALPVGAFGYSEGLETLNYQGKLDSVAPLRHWLSQELAYGGVRLEVAIAHRAYQNYHHPEQLRYWNHWLTAARETEELRQQSLQMGRALARLAESLHPELIPTLKVCSPCHFAIAFGILAAHWQIPLEMALMGYLQSWVNNLITAAIKLIPLGQTEGQALLLDLSEQISLSVNPILEWSDEQLCVSGWGVSLASMQHETLYTRLFRS